VLGSVTTAANWFALASDGSYVVTGNSSAVTVWSPTSGQSIFSHSGNYSAAAVYAAPGAVQIALGAAGASVIETLAVPGGTSTVSAPFQGEFNTWFTDGAQFLTAQGTTVWTYLSAAVEQDITSVSSGASGGEGTWFWSVASSGVTVITVYAVGNSAAPTASYMVGAEAIVTASGTTLGMLDPAAAGPLATPPANGRGWPPAFGPDPISHGSESDES
jgi:hypothetical protein